jgi:hypothetical protein
MDLRHGYGTLNYIDGGRYSGDWANNNKHGHGCYSYPDGTAYLGDWKQDKKHGFGDFTGKYGSVTKSEWKAGEKIRTFEEAQEVDLIQGRWLKKVWKEQAASGIEGL